MWVRSAGLDELATVHLGPGLAMWADLIFCFEHGQARKIRKLVGDLVPIFNLGIPDRYDAGDPELIAMLRARVPPLLAAGQGQVRSAEGQGQVRSAADLQWDQDEPGATAAS